MGVNDNTDLGFRDLLFNSGVACMLLFIIFSVRMGKESLQVENVTQISNQNFHFQDQYSLLVTETIEEENYRSLFAVDVAGVSPGQYESLRVSEFARWSDEDNEEQYVFYDNEAQQLTLYMIVGRLPGNSVSLKFLDNSSLGRPHSITAKIIDGKAMLETDNNAGLFEHTWPQPITLREKEFIFRPTQLDPDDQELLNDLFDVR